MKVAAVPKNEVARLKSLRELEVLDTQPEAEFDAIARAASRFCILCARHQQLRDMGIDFAQGYLIHTLEQLGSLLRKQVDEEEFSTNWL